MNINTPETDAYECAMAEDPGNYFGEDSTREAYEFARKLERRLIIALQSRIVPTTAKTARKKS